VKYDFSNKVVFITGAGRGIGRAIAEAFAKTGAKLGLISRTDNVIKTAEALSGRTKTLAFSGDVSDYQFVKNSVSVVIEEFGTIDILVNAAAVLGPAGILPDNDVGKWMQTINTNLTGTFLTIHEVLPVMLSKKQGKIINFAGGGAAYAYPKFTAYACSKTAVVRLTETVAQEVSQYNIQVNVIAPGAVETDMLSQVRIAGGEVRTTVTMDKPVNLVLYLASQYSNHISGRFIHSKDDYTNFPVELDDDLYKLRRLPLR
jgi:NAD(P)-dependent dehydrogenase (short-subunit alcohol dehydrogenase family)